MLEKVKILFIIPSLRVGGAERVISFIASKLDFDLFDVKLIVIGYKKDSVYNVDSIQVKFLNKSRLLYSVIKLYRSLRKERPNIVLSSIGHVNILMGLFGMVFGKIKFIGRESSVASRMNEFSRIDSKINHILIKHFYPKLAAVICQSEDMKQDLIDTTQLNPLKLVVIHNPITNFKSLIKDRKSNGVINFVTVGRLSEEKGHLRIINGLNKIKKYDYHYTIIGSGPLEILIKEKLEKLQIMGKVSFIPYTSNVLEEVIKSDYFIQGSFVEGFPNALLESCTVGTPVIAFNAPGGTKDIVINGLNGFLVEDELEFISVLNDLDRLKLIDREQVIKSVTKKFSPEIIVKQYEELFQDLIQWKKY